MTNLENSRIPPGRLALLSSVALEELNGAYPDRQSL
jgi:hypothetical protein